MRIKLFAITAFLVLTSIIYAPTASALENEQCGEGPIVGGKQTIRNDGNALFFDLQVLQADRSVCIVRAAIDIREKDVSKWKTYVTDETMADNNETLDNVVLSGSMEIRRPGVATINVRLQEIKTGKVWDFPEFTLIARDGRRPYK